MSGVTIEHRLNNMLVALAALDDLERSGKPEQTPTIQATITLVEREITHLKAELDAEGGGSA